MVSFTDYLRPERDKFFPEFALIYINNDPVLALEGGTACRATSQQAPWKLAL